MATRAVVQRLGVLACWFGVATCERSPGPRAPSTGAIQSGHTVPIQPTQLKSEFAPIAAAIASPLMATTESVVLTKDAAQLLAEANVKIMTLEAAHPSDAKMSFVAREAATAYRELWEQRDKLEAASQQGGGVFITGLLGIALKDPGVVLKSLDGVIEHAESLKAGQTRIAHATKRIQAAELMLPACIQGVDPASVTKTQLLQVDLDEAWASSAAFDLVRLTNASDGTLHNCTVLVELRGRSEVKQHVHFVPEWPSGASKYAKYSSGIRVFGETVGRETINDIDSCRVSVWADEASAEDHIYQYAGKERDLDRETLLKGLQLEYKYVPRPILGVGRCLDLTPIGGPAVLPAHKVILVFSRWDQSHEQLALQWDLQTWDRGRPRRFDSGKALPWDPASVEVRITFADSGYVWRQAITLPEEPRN